MLSGEHGLVGARAGKKGNEGGSKLSSRSDPRRDHANTTGRGKRPALIREQDEQPTAQPAATWSRQREKLAPSQLFDSASTRRTHAYRRTEKHARRDNNRASRWNLANSGTKNLVKCQENCQGIEKLPEKKKTDENNMRYPAKAWNQQSGNMQPTMPEEIGEKRCRQES